MIDFKKIKEMQIKAEKRKQKAVEAIERASAIKKAE